MEIWVKRELVAAIMAVIVTLLVLGLDSLDGGESGGNNGGVNLSDGTYIPDQFHFSGGTGRISISCPEIAVRNGQAYATIIFSSGYYSYVKAGGVTYYGSNTASSSTFEIPVQLNHNNTITGCTTKMSSPHEITYSIFIYIKNSDDNASGDLAVKEGKADVRSPSAELSKEAPEIPEISEIPGLTYESKLELTYAETFDIYAYNDGFKVIVVKDSASYLVVPPGAEVPDGLPEEMTILKKPLSRIYVAGTATMAMFHALDGLKEIRFSGLRADGWYVDAAREAMEAGEIKFAGRYSEPDYEMLVNEGCDLAVESQMIYHTPKVMELLQMMDIPVFVDCSSNEGHPLGRVEWIKVYGALLDKEEEADAFFKEQTKVLDDLKDFKNTEKSVVYFFINSAGQAVVRTGTDYMAKMIEIAGGRYPFAKLTDGTKSTATITMEEFYAVASDADYLIYNASIDNKLESLNDLTAKDEILKNMKAVKEGNVFCTDKDFYQATDIASEMISDIHIMLTGGNEDEMTFLYRVGK